MIQDYVFARSVDAAIDFLIDKAGKAKVIAGGTALLLDGIRYKGVQDWYVSLANIGELDGVVREDGFLVIGANTTLTQCADNALIQENAPSLVQAAGNLASTQIRNMATVAGNVCAARPFGDAAVALAALGATCVIKSKEGSREVAVTDLYPRLGESVVDSTKEVLTHIKFPVRAAGDGAGFERLQLRKGLSFPIVNVGVKLHLENGVVSSAAIVAGPLSPGPQRVPSAEGFLVGKAPSEEAFAQAGDLATQAVQFHDSPQRCRVHLTEECSYETCRFCVNPVHSSAGYRHKVLPVLVRRALIQAAGRAA